MKLNYSLKIFKNGYVIEKQTTHFKKRFLKTLRTINWKDRGLKVYVKVNYGKHLDVWGKYTVFTNEGDYTNKKDLWLAVNAFLEEC